MTFAHLPESAPIPVMNTQGSETGVTGAAAVRVRAVRLVCTEGWSTADAALAVGRSQRGKKPERLAPKKAPGATPKLDKKQSVLASLPGCQSPSTRVQWFRDRSTTGYSL
jgi:hypothetical protein